MPSRKSAGRRKRSELSIRTYTVVLGVDCISSRADLVPHPPHGHDRRGLAELAPQLSHVHTDAARVAGELAAPDPFQELSAGEHGATMVEELPQQIELLRRELNFLRADLDREP